jgi:hypothetical protein
MRFRVYTVRLIRPIRTRFRYAFTMRLGSPHNVSR